MVPVTSEALVFQVFDFVLVLVFEFGMCHELMGATIKNIFTYSIC